MQERRRAEASSEVLIKRCSQLRWYSIDNAMNELFGYSILVSFDLLKMSRVIWPNGKKRRIMECITSFIVMSIFRSFLTFAESSSCMYLSCDYTPTFVNIYTLVNICSACPSRRDLFLHFVQLVDRNHAEGHAQASIPIIRFVFHVEEKTTYVINISSSSSGNYPCSHPFPQFVVCQFLCVQFSLEVKICRVWKRQSCCVGILLVRVGCVGPQMRFLDNR